MYVVKVEGLSATKDILMKLSDSRIWMHSSGATATVSTSLLDLTGRLGRGRFLRTWRHFSREALLPHHANVITSDHHVCMCFLRRNQPWKPTFQLVSVLQGGV